MDRFRSLLKIFVLFIFANYSLATLAAGNTSTSLYKIKSGDTVYSILRRHGFNDNQLKAALSQNPIPKNFVLSDNSIYRAQANNSNATFEVQFYAKDNPEAYVFWRSAKRQNNSSDTIAGARKQSIDFDVRVARASGRLRGSLVENLTQAIGDELVAYRFMDAFLLDYSNLPRLLHRNAPFALTFEKLYENGQFIRYGEVLRAELEINGQNVVRKFKRLKTGGLFVNEDSDYSERPFYSPVNYIRFSSLFQPRRFHPIRKHLRSHQGIDFELREGAPVYSASSGKVLRVGRNRAAGNFVVLRHVGGYESYYNHLKSTSALRPQQNIAAGDVIGEVGCTGYCTKPHLHFAIKKNNQYVNPITLIRNYSFTQKSELHSFLSRAGL